MLYPYRIHERHEFLVLCLFLDDRGLLQVACECLDWLHELSGQALCENHTYSYYYNRHYKHGRYTACKHVPDTSCCNRDTQYRSIIEPYGMIEGIAVHGG